MSVIEIFSFGEFKVAEDQCMENRQIVISSLGFERFRHASPLLTLQAILFIKKYHHDSENESFSDCHHLTED